MQINARNVGLLLVASLAVLFAGCHRHGTPNPSGTIVYSQPTLPKPRELAKGISLYTVSMPGRGSGKNVWIYAPNPLPASKIPCVLIAPAGTPMYYVIGLSASDRAEHLPYVKAGMAVVAFEIDGAATDTRMDESMLWSVREFMSAEGGVDNEKAALKYALARLPFVDTSRVYVAGRGSAATLALQCAESDTRIKGCVAFGPTCDLEAKLKEAIPIFGSRIESYPEFVHDH